MRASEECARRGTHGPHSGPEYCHERLSSSFDKLISEYDTKRRIEVLVGEFLRNDMISGKEILEVGCGLGYFSEVLCSRGGIVTACDISPSLVQRTRERVGCSCLLADALNLEACFGSRRFDVVVSSECIEHTQYPEKALIQMIRILKPGGYLSMSTPNILWQPLVRAASALRVRPYDGFENFSSWSRLRTLLRSNAMTIVNERGIHLYPFQLGGFGVLRWSDRRLQFLKKIMINICICAQKAQ